MTEEEIQNFIISHFWLINTQETISQEVLHDFLQKLTKLINQPVNDPKSRQISIQVQQMKSKEKLELISQMLRPWDLSMPTWAMSSYSSTRETWREISSRR